MRKTALRLFSIPLICLLPLLSSGCYQDMLKATPFARGVGEESAENRIALWPLFYHRKPATSFLWPMGEITDDSWAIRPFIAVYGEQRSDILWPFIHVDGENRSGHFAPLVAWKAGPNGFLWTPLIGWRSPRESAGWFYTPLYTTGWGTEKHWRFAPPLLTAWGHRGEKSWYGSPLYVEVMDAERADRALPFLLSWWSVSKKGDWSANVLLSLFGITRSSERSSEHLFPFYWRGEIEREGSPRKSSWWALVPFYAGARGRDGSRFDGLPFLLSARSVTASGNPGWHLLLSTVAWGSRPAGRDSEDATFHRILPFYYYDTEPRRTQFGILPPLYGHTVHESGAWSADYLLFLGKISKSAKREASRFFPLYSWSRRRLEVSDEAKGGETPESEPAPARPVEKEQFDFLVYFYDHLVERYEDGDEYRRHRVLWRLYHDEARRDSRSIDIFPFITYDRIDEESSLTWSWLYKFVRYERRGDKKALNLFFLPAIRW